MHQSNCACPGTGNQKKTKKISLTPPILDSRLRLKFSIFLSNLPTCITVCTLLETNHIDNFEIILINDGSRDKTSDMARVICSHDKRVKLISFSKNFGHQIAITSGLDKAPGQILIIIGADLQYPPEVILEMISKWKEGYQMVWLVMASF